MYMQVGEKNYPVIIIKKNNKNSYIRITDQFEIQVTTSRFTSVSMIQKILEKNKKSIVKMIEQKQKKIEHEKKFWYLGKNYDIIRMPSIKNIEIEGNRIFIPGEKQFTLWWKKELTRVFKERLDDLYSRFEEKIPYPTLKIRTMKTRWGVCNKKDNSITLNSKLLEYGIEEIDYVIIHELSHFVHFNHSSAFWLTVQKYCPNYKMSRKHLKEV